MAEQWNLWRLAEIRPELPNDAKENLSLKHAYSVSLFGTTSPEVYGGNITK